MSEVTIKTTDKDTNYSITFPNNDRLDVEHHGDQCTITINQSRRVTLNSHELQLLIDSMCRNQQNHNVNSTQQKQYIKRNDVDLSRCEAAQRWKCSMMIW